MNAIAWTFLVDRLIGYLADGTELHYAEIGGPSVDGDNNALAKPTTAPGGAALCAMSIAVESDTGKVFFYDPNDGWTEQFTFQQS